MKKEKKHFYFAIAAIAGCILVMISDYLLEYKGAIPSNSLGAVGIVETAWSQMPLWRFVVSLNLSAFSVPLFLLGYLVLKRQMEQVNKRYAQVFFWSAVAGNMGAVFLHVVLCLMPIIYKIICEASQDTLAVEVMDRFYYVISPAFWVFYFAEVLLPPIIFIAAILKKKTPYHKVCVLFNGVTFLILALILTAVGGERMEWIVIGSATRGIMALFIIAAVYQWKKKGWRGVK